MLHCLHLDQAKVKKYIFILLLLALAFRLLTAYISFGPQSVDDYTHAVLPAIEVNRGQPLELPAWRSPLLPQILIQVVAVAKASGMTSQIQQIRTQLCFLALFSMLIPISFAFLQSRKLTLNLAPNPQNESDRRYFWLAMTGLCLHIVIIFASTRAFGESVAMSLCFAGILLLSEVFFTKQCSRTKSILGLLMICLACLFRFQVGILFLPIFAYIIYLKKWPMLIYLMLLGILTAALQGLIDLSVGRYPLQTLAEYFLINKDGGIHHSDQPWINTWLTLFAFAFLPISAGLFIKTKALTQELKFILVCILCFTLFHSLIPHKEERFLYPIMPLTILVLAYLWSQAWGLWHEKWVLRPFASLILFLGLCIVPISNSQEGELEPLRVADQTTGPTWIWDYQSLLFESSFRGRLMNPIGRGNLNYKNWLQAPTKAEVEAALKEQELVLVTSSEEGRKLFEQFESIPTCSKIKNIQSLSDALIYKIHPSSNQRRRPTWLISCFK